MIVDTAGLDPDYVESRLQSWMFSLEAQKIV
jgi:hypothetical protein